MNTNTIKDFVHQFVFFVVCLPCLCICLETDTISFGSVLKDPDSIVSTGRVFKLGFFTPENTTNRYLAVFYVVSEKTVVWVANRDDPIHDFSGTATISKDGDLLLINGRNQTVWSTGVAAATSPVNTTLQVQDTGNLVLFDNETGATIWESFSEPSNTYLPTMKLSHNIKTGKKVHLSSWISATDPRIGIFTEGIEVDSRVPQSFVWDVDGRPLWRSGPWNGLIFLGIHEMFYGYTDGFSEVKNESDNFYFSKPPELNLLVKFDLNSSGSVMRTQWDDRKKEWDTVWTAPANECDKYGRCGPFGSCSIQDSPICSCVRGFEPVDMNEWESGNWSSGCIRKDELQCDTDGFLKLQFLKVPDFPVQFFSRQEEECQSRCTRNCSCVAYAHDSNIGCMFWSRDLIDIQKFAGVGVDLHIRLSASELGKHKDKKLHIIIPVVTSSVGISMIIFIAWCWMVKRKRDKTKDKTVIEAGQRFFSDSTVIVLKDESERVNIQELPLFAFVELANATNQFDENNLLGKGGFGSVYKGNLGNGKEIAVKRLSAASGQGTEEFMNEVVVISKVQHRNLVRLVGCCVENEEKMLVYEYMPNKSLDICLFDPSHPSQKILDWAKRFSIIEGTGRGLLYLHRDSRLKIIHRDLKPSNVLLDEDWNPKISDFGMARIFGGNQDHGNTARVVGTYGYMAPEYAMEGRFSEKSDVYSFGVLMLEIVKGKKKIHYYNHEWSLSLLGCAWKLWSEDNGLAFADERISSSNSSLGAEIGRCIQIALLCVQEFPDDRPTIQTLLSMLSYEIVDLPSPEQPVFAEQWNGGSTQLANQDGYSINELTLSGLHGR